jgi:hypothetical protein
MLLMPGIALAQSKTATVSPAPAKASPAPATPTAPAAAKRTVTVTVARPGNYQLYVPGRAGVEQFPAGDRPTLPITLRPDTAEIYVIDQTAGTVAVFAAADLKAGKKAEVFPNDFKFAREVAVAVFAPKGHAAAGTVTLTDAAGTRHSHLLTGHDMGVARFKNVPLGKATVQAAYAADGPQATQDIVVTPARTGGRPQSTLTLSGDVPTVSVAHGSEEPASSATPVPVASPPEPPANNWVPGIIGLGLLAGGIYYGVRQLKARGVTVEDSLRKMGVELPQDGRGSLAAPLKPAAPPPPPLPSLADLPAAGPATGGGAPLGASAFGVASAAGTMTAVRNAPRLVGLSGSVAGEQFPLDSGATFSVGRDDANTLALTQDTAVSRRHARFEQQGDAWAVADEGSSNGTFVNGQRVAGGQTLRPGDEIQIGASRFRFEG